MNLARIHDKQSTKTFWEQKIERHGKMTGNEELRLKNSALSKLRDEWVTKLELRTREQRSVNEERVQRAERHQNALGL